MARCLICKSSVKIRWHELQLTSVSSDISSIIKRRSLLILWQIFSTFQAVEGNPERAWSSKPISPCLKLPIHSKMCVSHNICLESLLMHLVSSCWRFFKQETKLQTHSLTTSQEVYDNSMNNTILRSNVRLQTDAAWQVVSSWSLLTLTYLENSLVRLRMAARFQSGFFRTRPVYTSSSVLR